MNLKLNQKNTKLWATLQFLIRLLALSVPLYLILAFAVDMSALQTITAGNANFILSTLGLQVSQEEALLTVTSIENPKPFIFLISPDSTPWKALLFMLAMIIAVPGVLWKKRLLGLAITLPLVWLGNLVRVVGIVLIERSMGPETAMWTHDWLWRVWLVFLVLVLWALWLKWLNIHSKI